MITGYVWVFHLNLVTHIGMLRQITIYMTLIFVVEHFHNDTIIMKIVFTKSFAHHIFGYYYSVFVLRMPFSCQEQSCLRSKRANQISDYVVIRFVRARHNHSVKNGVFIKDSHIYAPGKTIYIQVKYYCDQEAKKFRHLISLPEGYW